MTSANLEELSREELIGLLLAQAEQMAAFQAMIVQLQTDNEALRIKLEKLQKPPTSSSNSSQPPSRDQKRNKPANRPKRKHGPPSGHVKYTDRKSKECIRHKRVAANHQVRVQSSRSKGSSTRFGTGQG
jgi:hypothetical protein